MSCCSTYLFDGPFFELFFADFFPDNFEDFLLFAAGRHLPVVPICSLNNWLFETIEV